MKCSRKNVEEVKQKRKTDGKWMMRERARGKAENRERHGEKARESLVKG